MLYKFKQFITNWTKLNLDKLMHYIMSQILFVVLFVVLFLAGIPYALLIAITISFAIGVVVELLDYTTGKGNAEIADILANSAGILTAAIPIYLLSLYS